MVVSIGFLWLFEDRVCGVCGLRGKKKTYQIKVKGCLSTGYSDTKLVLLQVEKV